VAAKWDYSGRRKKVGRPSPSAEVVELVLRMARENPTWGYDRIQGALANLGHEITNTWVGSILKAHGVEPAPDRKRQSTWKSSLQAHWNVLASVDFTTIEIWTKSGLVTVYLFFVMELATRRVYFAGSTANPDELWMLQAGQESERRRRWIPAREEVPADGSRGEVLRGVPCHPGANKRERCALAAPLAQLESEYRALYAIGQERKPGSAGLPTPGAKYGTLKAIFMVAGFLCRTRKLAVRAWRSGTSGLSPVKRGVSFWTANKGSMQTAATRYLDPLRTVMMTFP